MEFWENRQDAEKSVLVGIDTGDFDAEVSLCELEELAKTAGSEVAAKLIQKRESPDAATCVGSGRLFEIKEFCDANDIDLIIFDLELSPSQQRNIEKITDVRTIDRTTLILDIFAARARSREGKLQVELAQLRYRLPRLGGMGTQLSRLGGGIGTRGPGETKLESDRRHIRRRIESLSAQLAELEKRRERLRSRRTKTNVQTVAIVGYTNAGKSTLMNALTGAGVLAENKLFATLDPTARALTLPSGREVILVDTVGLVRRLPHELVEAFKSTLEEAAAADLILNVCDASSPECAEHLEVTRKLLKELNCDESRIISVMNKCDLAPDVLSLPAIGSTVMISAKTGEGLPALLEKTEAALPGSYCTAELLIPFDKGVLTGKIRSEGTVSEQEYTENGLRLVATLPAAMLDGELKPYVVNLI